MRYNWWSNRFFFNADFIKIRIVILFCFLLLSTVDNWNDFLWIDTSFFAHGIAKKQFRNISLTLSECFVYIFHFYGFFFFIKYKFPHDFLVIVSSNWLVIRILHSTTNHASNKYSFFFVKNDQPMTLTVYSNCGDKRNRLKELLYREEEIGHL